MSEQNLQGDKVAILILNYNGCQDTLHCLQSMEKVNGSFEVIVIDNGSKDDSVEKISHQFPRVTLLQTNENLGYAGGNNYGIRYALSKEFSHLLLLNNDVEVDENFLLPLLKRDRKFSYPVILSPAIAQFQDRQKIDHLGGYWNPRTYSIDLAFQDHPLTEVSKQEILPVDYVCGCCLFARKEVFERVGPLDERFFLLWEETDFCFRAKMQGIQSYILPEATIFHKGSASFSGGKVHTHYFWWRNRLLFMQKHNLFSKGARLFLFKELQKQFRHLFLHAFKSLFNKNRLKHTLNFKRNLASLQGGLDYFRMRFGNAPRWVFKK